MYAKVVFPLPFRNAFTYSIPDELEVDVSVGIRVVVPFGKRILTGFVIELIEEPDTKDRIKPIQDYLDEFPIFDKKSIKFYEWLSSYYLSSLGEALKNAVPFSNKTESKKRIISDTDYCKSLLQKENVSNSNRSKLLNILSTTESISLDRLKKESKIRNIYHHLKQFEKEGAIEVVTELYSKKSRIKTVKTVELNKSKEEIQLSLPEIEKRSPKQVLILLELLSSKVNELQIPVMMKKLNLNKSSFDSLEKKELIKISQIEVERKFKDHLPEEFKEIVLSDDQLKIINMVSASIVSKSFEPYLLHGVTGSGKTQVYIELAKVALDQGKDVLILVPEISLTPQITNRFYHSFGELVTVMHSRMSNGEKYDSWRGIVGGKYKIVIGPRSALFAPLNNLGIIIIDEEHDSSYKQNDILPRYNARDAAILKAKFSDCPVLLGSATPSVETMHNVESGKFKLVELPSRIDNARLPNITLVDVSQEKKIDRMSGNFSQILIEAIAKRIESSEGTILLQNRRGFSTQVYCEDCGEVILCDNCSVPLVYHLNKDYLKCHYCEVIKRSPKACKNCGSIALKFFGVGTQRVEDELEYHFPNARIARIDSDSTTKRGSLSSILNSFRKGEIDILIGTQMVSKGLDFSHVTLVGVISAETTLWMPDFRADERTFNLLTQVAGRSGRSNKPGEVIIQTQNKDHFVLQKVLENNYEGFYKKEISVRKLSGYPPFVRLALIETKDENEVKARRAAEDIYKLLNKKNMGLIICPVNEAVISKIKNFYRFHILIKSRRSEDPNGSKLRNVVLNSYIDFKRLSKFRNVRVLIDVDPHSVL